MNEKIIDTIQILSSYGVPQDEEKFKKAVDEAVKGLQHLMIVSEALLDIMDQECCEYGHEVAARIAEEVTGRGKNDTSNS